MPTARPSSTRVVSTISRSTLPWPSIATGRRKNSKWIVTGLSDRSAAAKARRWPTVLRRPGFERRVGLDGRQVGGADQRLGARQMAELAGLLGGEARLMRPAPPDDMDVADARAVEQIVGVRRDIGFVQFGARLGEDARAIDRDVAVADDRGAVMAERYVEDRRNRGGRCTSRRTPPSRRRRADRRRGCRAGGRAVRRWKARRRRTVASVRRCGRRFRRSHCRRSARLRPGSSRHSVCSPP